MVRLYNKTKLASAVTLAAIAPVAALVATSPKGADAADVPFNVDIPEVITMTIGEPTNWASGDVNTLLKNKITISAQSNNSVGVTVSMHANNTNLINQTNSAYTIPTLTSDCSSCNDTNFPTNRWGYSKDDSTYSPLSTSAIGIISATGAGSTASKDVYFGAKADSTKLSGTYAQTVYFTAVTGTVDTNPPVVPVNPAPATPDPVNSNPTYDSTVGSTSGSVSGSTRYTTRGTTGSGTSSTDGEKRTTTTQVSAGNTTSSYAAAQGVTTSTSTIDGGASVATALGVAAAVAATSGTVFFLLAKRKKDEDEEE